jgi:hypothetical protein
MRAQGQADIVPAEEAARLQLQQNYSNMLGITKEAVK